MENRKELSEKSKKLIAKQFNSDILNKNSGYYKKENIYPITSKPNELKINIKEFIPQFKEEKPYERKFNNLLSDKQRNNSFILKYKNIAPNKNKELEIIRKRNKTIKDNCLDNKGNLSCRKRYILEFYGIQKLNNTFDHNINIIKKDKDKEESRNLNKEIIIKNKKRIRELILMSRNFENYNKERYNTISNDINNSFFNIINNQKYNKISRNKEVFQVNTTINTTNPLKIFNRLKTDIHYPNEFLNSTQTSIIKKPKNFLHSKDISKIFYTKSNNPVKNIRVKNNKLNKEDKEHYILEFELKKENLKNDNKDLTDKLEQKNIKEIFYKNGLHIYDINEDDMNILSIKKKMEAKLRVKKDDDNFENNYNKALIILDKKGIKVEKEQISNEKGYQNIVKKKRKGTPGKILYENRFHKDENTKLNTGNNDYFKKKNKIVLPQYNKDYKNFYKYKLNN